MGPRYRQLGWFKRWRRRLHLPSVPVTRYNRLESSLGLVTGLAIHRGPIPETRCFRSRHMSLCTEMPLPLGWSLVPNLGRCVPNRQLSLHRWIANALLPPCLGSPSSVFGRRLVCMIAEIALAGSNWFPCWSLAYDGDDVCVPKTMKLMALYGSAGDSVTTYLRCLFAAAAQVSFNLGVVIRSP